MHRGVRILRTCHSCQRLTVSPLTNILLSWFLKTKEWSVTSKQAIYTQYLLASAMI